MNQKVPAGGRVEEKKESTIFLEAWTNSGVRERKVRVKTYIKRETKIMSEVMICKV